MEHTEIGYIIQQRVTLNLALSYSITTLRELVKAIVLYPLPFEGMESSSQKLSETSKKVIDDLLSTYERARGIVNSSVCLKVFFWNFSSANRVYVLLTATKNWIEYDTARKGLQKGRYDLLMFVYKPRTCLLSVLLLRYTKNRREERMIWKKI